MQKPNFSLHGAIDLGARAAAAKAQQERQERAAAGTDAVPAGSYVIDVTDQTFNVEVMERSLQVPVMLDFWADWCEPCKQLGPILEKLAAEGAGSWILAKIDIEANPGLAAEMQRMGVRGIPFVAVVVQGQLMPFLNGAAPEPQIRQATDELWAALREQGLMGDAPPASGEPLPAEPQADPVYAAAEDALRRGDLEAAAAAFKDILAKDPRNETAKRRLALSELSLRVKSYDEASISGDDVASQLRAADVELLRGDVEGAFDRLVQVVRRTSGDDRNAARVHLLALFDTLPSDDPRVGKARRSLQSALF